jgi:alanyl-tRNA synthetase
VKEGTLKVGDPLLLEVDHARRAAIRQNHSATHLLHEALRQVLGDHVAQKGSLVAPDRLRFDFSHPKPISADELERVEDIANDIVLQNAAVTTRLMAQDDAIASGARALFGEKYGDEVRVVAMGDSSNALGWSVELCGGTHVKRTGDIGVISVVGDSGVAAGVRRIEALTGKAARKAANHQFELVKAAAAELKAPPEDMPARVASLLEERKKLERELSEAKKKLAMGGGGGAQAADDVRQVNGVKLIARAVSGIELKDLRSLADEGKKQVGSGIVAIVGLADDGKAGIVVGVTKDLTERFNAVDLVRKGAEALGGKGGGGRPDMAQAGGPDGSKAEAALKAIEAAIGV